jgi:hypothetical protein
MATVKNPVLFSKYFAIDPERLNEAGLIDPFLNVDTQLFIDPVLLEKSANPVIRADALSAFRNHFENFVRLLIISRAEGDAAWRAAQGLLTFTNSRKTDLAMVAAADPAVRGRTKSETLWYEQQKKLLIWVPATLK